MAEIYDKDGDYNDGVYGDGDGDENNITILCELIGARNLKVQDDDEIDPNIVRPYCVVKYDGKRIHKSLPSKERGCNPIWTPYSTKSCFLLKTTPREISRSIMNISLYTTGGSTLSSLLTTVNNVFLGQVNIDSDTILSHCNENRFELNIEDELGEPTSNIGKLALRLRVATPSDIKLLHHLSEKFQQKELISSSGSPATAHIFQKSAARQVATLITERDESKIAQKNFVQSVGNIFAAHTSTCAETGLTKVRVKPYPDPDRPKETEFLKPRDINLETRSPSTKWIEAGSGSLGRLFVEILSCEDLPNLDDPSGVMGDYTDSFCTLVYEDTCAMTEVIYDELNPKWLPWTTRAFCFNVIHPSSILYLGVFDYDLLGNHDPIGRVAVNVCNLQRETIHTLKYSLFPSSNLTDRSAIGNITVRIRLEWFNPRAVLLEGLKPRPDMHVNVTKEKSFKVIRYVCIGEYEEEKFDLTVTRSYIHEILEYKSALSYVISDTFRSLILWRGQVEVFSVMIPLHSMILFVASSKLVERPQLIVPYSLLIVAWIMFANLTIRRQHPSPWQSRLSFFDYVNILRTGKSSTRVKCIKEFEGAEAARQYEHAWKKRIDKDRKMADKKAELLKEINSIEGVNIHTEVSQQGVIPLDLLVRLGRYQGIIGKVCRKFRFVKIILTWEESVVSFWSGIVALLFPWGFILTWTGRLCVWGLLGPHMKLVDLFLRANERKDGGVSELMEAFNMESNRARLIREEALKVKDIKGIAFGTYSVQVPLFNLSAVVDHPLPESSSRIYRKNPHRRRNRRVSVTDVGNQDPLIPGQQLYGTMIPRPEFDEKVLQNQIVVAKKKLSMFLSCLKIINESNGLSEHERKQLMKLNAIGIPMTFGYEIIPFDSRSETFTRVPSIDSESDLEFEEELEGKVIEIERKPHQQSRRVTIKLISDTPGCIDRRETKEMVMESKGSKTYCISDQTFEVEEEGLEVIGIGRFQSSSYNINDSVDEALVLNDSKVPQCVEKRLSSVFKSDENIQLLFYRPPKGEIY